MAKEKMDPEKKYKLIFSLELIIIGVVAAVIAILRITNVLGDSETRLRIYNWITIFGGSWIVIDFILMFISPNHRAKNSMFDKMLNLPLGIGLIVFDIICFIHNSQPTDITRITASSLIMYLGVDYIIQGIYHYYRPLPAVLQAIEEAKKEPIEAEIVEEKPIEGNKDSKL